MKKIIFKILVIALLGVFTLIGGSNPALAEDKYGGILKIATDKAGTGYRLRGKHRSGVWSASAL